MMQTPKDIFTICQNDNDFIGKPLKVLLDEIKPAIKMVFAEGGWQERAPRISFFFMTRNEYQDCINKNKSPLRLTVYLGNVFEWSFEKRTKAHFWEWTKQDEEKNGNNIITLIRVSGDCDTCENEMAAVF